MTCVFCVRPVALGDLTKCTWHQAVSASLIDPDQAHWDRTHPGSTWRSNKAEAAERERKA